MTRAAVIFLPLVFLLIRPAAAQPEGAAVSVTTTSTKGWSHTRTFNHLGLPTSSTLSGTGIPTTGLDPVWRADGSLASVELTIGGESHTAAFNPDGTLSSLTAPGRGNILDGHTIANGVETLTVDGVTHVAKLDGTQVTTTGTDIIGQTDTLTAGVGGFQQTTHPLALGANTTTDFNAAGAPTAKNYAAGAGESYGYVGELLTSVSLARGGQLDLGYSPDGAKDLVSAVWPTMVSGTGPDAFTLPAVTHGFGYDRAGRVDGIGDASGARSLGYDKGRLVTAVYTSGPLKGYEIIRHRDGTGRDTGFTLKRDDAVIHSATKTPNGVSDQISALERDTLKAVPQRDGAGRITGFQWGNAMGTFVPAVTQTWQRGVGGRIGAAGSDVSGAPDFDYLIDPNNPGQSFDTRGRRLKCATAGGVWTYQYGTDGQLTSAAHTSLGTFSYHFDGIGRRTDKGTANTNDLLNRTLAWAHSQSKTLTVRAAQGARVWINGNKVQNFNGSASYAVPSPGQDGGWVEWNALAVLEGQGEGAGSPPANPLASPDAKSEQRGAVWVPPINETFTYDDAGNRESSAQWDYGWDGRNQLVRARTKGYSTAAKGYDLTFGYDSEGRRFREHVVEYRNGDRVSEKEITFVWDGWNMIYERHQLPSGLTTLERKYMWGPDIANGAAGGAGGLLLIRETKGSQTRDIIPLYDGTGHVVALTNTNKDLLASYAYGPFGELIHATGPAAQANPWRYATKYRDEETGLYYFGLRYHDPITGQWLSRELLGESESLNLYSYCHNDPVNKVDVLGLKEFPILNPTNPFVMKDGAWHRNEIMNHAADWFWQTSRGILPGTERIGRKAGPLDFAGWQLDGGTWRPTAANAGLARAFADKGWDLDSGAELTGIAGGSMIALATAPAALVYGTSVEAGAGLTVYGGHALRTAWANPWLQASGKAAFVGMVGGTGYGVATDASFRADYVAMEMSSPLPGEGTAMGIKGLGMMAMDARAGMGGLLSVGRRWVSPANWEFAPLGQFNMGAPLPRYVGSPKSAYSVAVEVRLPPVQMGMTRDQHFAFANRMLRSELASNPTLAKLVPYPWKLSHPPDGWTWQHATSTQNRLKLIA